MKISEKNKFYIRKCVANITRPFYLKQRKQLFEKQLKIGLDNIPIFIISYNRLSYLAQFIEQLEIFGLKNIHIIDNKSTYPPLLDYYKTCKYDVIYMDKNQGHKVFWNSDRFIEYRKSFYVVTDPDLKFCEECPKDFMKFFFEKLYKYPFVRKIGFSLKIDDLPNDSTTSDAAIKWEKQYYETYIKKDNLYYAGIDTTFALYVPDQLVNKQKFLSAFRGGKPYQMRHLPWYKRKVDITDEDIFYSKEKTNGWFDPVKGYKPDDL